MTPKTNKYIPIKWDNKRQVAFLLLNHVFEIFYGGAAGGGKSEALLAGAAQYVDVPGYSALLLRRTYKDLAMPGALMARSHEWWSGMKGAHWDGTNHQWRFGGDTKTGANGAVIQFGYLQHEGDEAQYQSAEFHFVGYDEVTQFSKQQYTYLFSRMRRLEGSDIPIRMRSAGNPGGRGHDWVRERFNLPYGPKDNPDRVFIPAFLDDNPYVDQESYDRGLRELSTVLHQQLRYGEWGARMSGGVLNPDHFQVIERGDLPPGRFISAPLRHWDMGSQEQTEEEQDPDWTAGAKISRMTMLPSRVQESLRKQDIAIPKPPFWLIWDIERAQATPANVEELIASTAYRDGLSVKVSLEQERGASGKLLVDAYRRHVIPGFTVLNLWAKGTKVERAGLVGGRAQEGRVFLLEGDWVDSFLMEAGVFGLKDVHDDQVDAVSGGYAQLERQLLMEEANDSQAEEVGGSKGRYVKRGSTHRDRAGKLGSRPRGRVGGRIGRR